VGQYDVEAALRRHLAIPQTRDRRYYSIKLTHYAFLIGLGTRFLLFLTIFLRMIK
jgi:hypothetical protein